MSLAIFDLDNTLLDGDSDFLWGRFLVEQGLVEAAVYERENERFFADYREGRLDIQEYLEFALRPLTVHEPAVLHAWREHFVAEWIRPVILPKAVELLQQHRDAGDTLIIITATTRFVTEPIADLLGVPHLLATEVEMRGGRYTGRSFDIPCFQEGKVRRLERWLEQTGHSLENSWFYSDSLNDLPLLSRVAHPVAVDPDAVLERHAREHGWRIISLRNR